MRRGPRGHHTKAAQRGPDLCGEQGLRRGGGVPAGGKGTEPLRPDRGPEGKGDLVLCRRHGRRALGPGGPYRARGPCDRLRGQGGQPPCPGEVRRGPVAAYKGAGELPERLGGGRGAVL